MNLHWMVLNATLFMNHQKQRSLISEPLPYLQISDYFEEINKKKLQMKRSHALGTLIEDGVTFFN